MKSIKFGIIAGLLFGIIDVIPMFYLDIPERDLAIISAFINRFAAGLLIFTSNWPMRKWLSGFLIGILLSLPYAIIAKTYAPILGAGAIGGLVIGIFAARLKSTK